ncbi:CinA [Ophiocordyceps sinensis CO18]|uniref:CinA n=1 Tax=Ophiocordyceps sinensis (strain Co18 / CGMCC 3.14243) TaxID=911162 RepID=T5ANH4_OPHSC|nr:CinA [Ophiocordyceps sinensis CO18]
MASNPIYTKRASETLRHVAGDVIELLKQAGETVGVAESLTGGAVMEALTSVEGASAAFRGGVVAYATPLKESLLDVDGHLIQRRGVVDGAVAEAMATGVRDLTATGEPTTWGVATTGVAGPAKQDGKDVGTVYIAVGSYQESRVWGPFCFPGDRHQIRQATVMEALVRLREMLLEQRERRGDQGEAS